MLGLLSSATTPEYLIARAQFHDAVASEQLGALATLERARVAKANVDSAARAAREQALARGQAAQEAKGLGRQRDRGAQQAAAARIGREANTEPAAAG